MMRRWAGAALVATLLVPTSASVATAAGTVPVAAVRLDVDNDGRQDVVTWRLKPTTRSERANGSYAGFPTAEVTVQFSGGGRASISLPRDFQYGPQGYSSFKASISVARLDPAGPPVLVLRFRQGYKQLIDDVMFVRAVGTGPRRSLVPVLFAAGGERAIFHNRSGFNVLASQLEAATGCDAAGGFVDQYRLFPARVGGPTGRGQLERKRYRWSAGALELATVDSIFDSGVKDCWNVLGTSTGVLEQFRTQIDPALSGPDPVPAPPIEPEVGGSSLVWSISGACWLLANRTVRCRGGLRGDSTSPFDESFFVDSFGGPVSGAHGVVDLAARPDRACVVLADGSVRCWGANVSGLLGDGTRRMRNFSVPAFDFSTASRVFLGDYGTCVIDSDSRPACWGTYENGSAGFGPAAPVVGPVRIDGVEGVESIWMGLPERGAGGRLESCALLRSAQVWCWDSVGSALREGNSLVPTEVHPVREVALDGATQIATGSGQLCGLVSGGVIRCPRSGFESSPGFVEVAVTPTTVCGRHTVGALTCWEVKGAPGEAPSFGGPIEVAVSDAVSLADGPCAITALGAKCWTVSNGKVSPIESFTEPSRKR